MSVARDRALVLRRFPFGESSLVAHVLTREHGRVHVLAKGAYRPGSRYFAVLDYFAALELEWDASEKRELATLRAGDVVAMRREIVRDLERYHAAMTAIELAELVSQPGAREPALYDLLDGTLVELAREASPARVLVGYEGRLLADLGLAPALEACASCGGAADSPQGAEARVTFSAGAGGRLCRKCAGEARASGRRVGTLPLEVLEDCLRLVQGRELGPPGARAHTAEERTERVREFLERFVEYHLETRPRTYRRSAAGRGARASRAASSSP